jgi:predicted permease
VASTRAELTAVHASLARDFPDDYKRDTPRLQALQSVLNDAVAQPLTALLAATVFVLLVACGNVAGLLLARASGRSSEMALRVALGAGRGRLARQLVAESVALGLPAMAGGYFVARAALTLLAERAPIVIPRLGGAAADPWLFVGAAAASALALALASLWPAWLASRTSALDSRLRATRVSAAAGTVRARRWMLGAQIAAAVLVTAGAALLYRTVDHLLAVDPGFRANGVVTAGFQLLGQRWAEDDAVRAFQKDVVARMRGLPGVRDAALAGQVPLGGNYDRWTARLPGGGNGANAQEVSAERYSVTPNYFSMMQVPLKRGRLLTDADRFGQDLVIVVNETFAREAWPGADPIGQRVRFGSDARPRPATVVGVVGDVRHYALSSPANPQFYATEDQLTDSFLVLLIQTDGARNAPAPDIRKAMAALAPDVPVYEIRPFDSIVSASVATRTFLLVLLASLGGATLVLAGVGVYGVTAESVTARRRELGIRVALGADGRRVAQTILGGNFRVVAAGIAIGLAASALAGFLARGLLFETTPIDPLALTTAAGLLLLSAAVAHVGPLRRAVRADPRNALTGD